MTAFQSVLTFTGFLPLMQVVIDDLMIHTHTRSPSFSHTLQIMLTLPSS